VPAFVRRESVARGASYAPDAGHTRVQARANAERIFFWLFIAALAWCPFWFGSNEPLAWGINAMLFPGLALAYELSVLLRGARHPVSIKTIAIPAALFAIVAVWILIQTTGWAPHALNHPLWDLAAETLERPVTPSVSVNRDLTNLALLRLVTAASAFWVALQLCRDGNRARLFVKAVAAIVCGYAAFGLLWLVAAPGYTLWFARIDMLATLTSTFINRNSFAAFAGVGLIAMTGLLLRAYRHRAATHSAQTRLRVAAFIETSGREGALLIAGAFIILVALLLTGSRGGIVATAFGLFTLGALTFGKRGRGAIDQRDAILFVVALGAAAFLVFGDVLFGKVSVVGLSDNARLSVYRITLGSILDSPLTGYGYGTFADVFPAFRDRSVAIGGRWLQAHDTYLEVLQGLGVFFGASLIACVVLLVLRCLRGATMRQENALVPALAASAGVLFGLHSLVDFSLQIQANTLIFMAILGAGVAQSTSSRIATAD
jgi:O-antigen ligase